jgi:phospholipid-binding lipoprotein MlaA
LTQSRNPRLVLVAASSALAVLVGCSTPVTPVEVHDPYEEQNRRTHRGNVDLDRAMLRPASRAWGAAVPQPVRRGAVNFAANLDTPGYVINDVLQGQVDDAVHNLFRFIINSTLGLAGVFDPASSIGLGPRSTDFGETLHVWGAPEGAYLELPVFGPSTERDAAGLVVDIIMNPVRLAFPDVPLSATATAVQIVDTRFILGATIDGVLYDSADSYAQSRTIYLQNRRFRLGGGGEDDYFDPYEELYGE